MCNGCRTLFDELQAGDGGGSPQLREEGVALVAVR